MFKLLRLVSVLNLIVTVVPFSDIRFITNRSSKTTHEGENCATTANTPLFSLQSDEDLFVDLFWENKKRNSSDNPLEERNTDNDTETARPIVRNKIPALYNIDEGAGVPRPSLQPDEIVSLLMTALENVDVPFVDAGLIAMWDFASDTTKFVFQNNRTEFIESCHETAQEFPTSFYGAGMNGKSWRIETELNRVGGDDGWIATQVTSTISSDGRLRRWQWELRKNRRPPCLGCWKVENIASSDRKGNFEPD